MKKIFTFFLTLSITWVNAQQSLTKTEQLLTEEVKKNYVHTLKILEEVTNINSGTLNKEGVRAVGTIFDREFKKIGFQTEWVNLPDSLNRAGHFVAYRKGTKGKKLFLIGHLDTVFEKSMPFTPFTWLNDSTATGQGVNDMKGGDVMILASLQALHKFNLLNDREIIVYFTGDEEESGKPTSISRADFIARAKGCDIALAYETTQAFNIGTVARRGASGWKLTVEGRQAHSSGIFKPYIGYGSIYEAARILNEFREQLSSEQYLTFNPGQIIGGTDVAYDNELAKGTSVGKTNIVAKKTYVTGDLRFLSEEQKERARERMRTIVSQNLTGTKASIEFTDGIPAMPPSDGNYKVLEALNKVSIDMGLGNVNAGDPGSRGAGDVSYVAEFLDCLDGLGASGHGAHEPGETINMNEYPFLIQRSTVFLYRLLAQ